MMVHMFLNFVIIVDFFNKIETMFIFTLFPSGLVLPTSKETIFWPFYVSCLLNSKQGFTDFLEELKFL